MLPNTKLKHIETLNADVPIERTFDYYVPCSLQIGKYPATQRTLYWRLVDSEFCLLEIGVDWYTGRFASLTVALYNGTLTHTIHPNLPINNLRTVGIPIFDRSLWPDAQPINYNVVAEYYDVSGRFSLSLENHDLYISLMEDKITYRVGLLTTFSCGFNQAAELCGIWLHNLNSSELANLQDSIKHSAAS